MTQNIHSRRVSSTVEKRSLRASWHQSVLTAVTHYSSVEAAPSTTQDTRLVSGPHIFVDETKRSGFLIAAVLIAATDLARSRQAVRSLLLGNQRRIHFKDERDSRKRQILDAILALQLSVRLYESDPRSGELAAWQSCLRSTRGGRGRSRHETNCD